MGFFIEIGNVKNVTIFTIFGNENEIKINVLFIFGYGPTPTMGIFGAALATGVAQILQTLFLMSLFLTKCNRNTRYFSLQTGLELFQRDFSIRSSSNFKRTDRSDLSFYFL